MRAITIVGLAALLLVQGAVAAVQDPDQRKCLVGFEKGVARFAKTAGRASLACLADASRGKDSLGSCVAADAKGKVERAEDKTRDTDQRLCDPRADFGVTDAASATASVRYEREGLLEALFGAPYDDAASTEKEAARCQAMALRSASKVADAHWRAATQSGKRAVASAQGPVEFERTVWDALADSQNLARLEAKTRSKVDARCAGVEAAALPGVCGAGDSGSCVAAAGACHFCRAWNQSTGAAFDCDSYDNGSEDGSCQSSGGVLYVATSGSDTNDGSPEAPLATLGTALAIAEQEGFGRVRMAAGAYPFSGDHVRNGVSIEGGFDPATWSAGGGETVLASSDWVGLHAVDVSAPTELANLTIESADASSGGSSYAVQASSSDGMRIRNSILRAGDGGDGLRGSPRNTGHDGDDGSNGESCTGGGCYSLNYGGSAGDAHCPGAGGHGGRGGDIPTPGLFEGSGKAGDPASGGSADGGGGGDECWAIFPVSCTGEGGGRGDDGDAGSRGQDGGAGAGGVSFGVYAPGGSSITQLGGNDFQAQGGGDGGTPGGVRGNSAGFGS